MKKMLCRVVPILLVLLMAGCEDEDKRVVEVAREASSRQAEQNRTMAELQQQVAEGSKQLVRADAEARRELAELQRELRADQAEIGRQRDVLEEERRKIAQDRYWDSVVGSAIATAAGIIACLLPLLVAAWLLYAIRDRQTTDEGLAELLVEELTADRPILLPPPQPVRALPYSPRPEPAGDAEAAAHTQSGD